jgi:hypothetical protein
LTVVQLPRDKTRIPSEMMRKNKTAPVNKSAAATVYLQFPILSYN